MNRALCFGIGFLIGVVLAHSQVFAGGGWIGQDTWAENKTIRGNATNVVNATFEVDPKMVNHQFMLAVNGSAPVAGSFSVYVDSGAGRWTNSTGQIQLTVNPAAVKTLTGSYSKVLLKLTTAIQRAGNASTKISYRAWR